MTAKHEVLSLRCSEEQGVSVSDVLRRAAEDAVRDARPKVCTGLCGQPQTISGWGFWSPTRLAGETKVYCGCGAVISSTLMFAATRPIT